ncbi:phosphonate transport system substrate-binding protein [Herbaspirillum sp. Sphag1AN]|uniref:PhnD/SsuA/transferrin family substrate-binding protein n=1 Tax=unclassified Herbaspirillum TaxID=2624150 RepID=UPI0016161780|nr:MULTISPECIES: PhnD/SsuA/transferrin family substrate-binding protein [unclassified Herbaspirillum]MBB3212330.1 phosphonate transport system substrate-binding protein [Herbaspirillum sp. Sphag1AN]MBB3245572.1 phosphonate transport system substrate-binding protein [Herbaspirillum sp. Sphag64]
MRPAYLSRLSVHRAWRLLHWTLILTGSILLASCHKAPAAPRVSYADTPVAVADGKHYIFLIHPLYNPQLLAQKFEPLLLYLDAHLPGVIFDLQTANDYDDFENKLIAGAADFALPNPYHALLARDWHYHVIARMADDDVFRGIFIVRKDSPIRLPADLKGKVVAYPAPTALAATMLTQLYLQQHGINVQTDITNLYVGTHNSSIMNTYLSQSSISATWPAAWEAFEQSNPKEAAQMQVLWKTNSLIQNPIIVRNDIPQAVGERVAQLLTSLQDSDPGRQILHDINTRAFIRSQDKDFDVVRRFLQDYNTQVKKSR